jgi:hypothetical protein
LVDLVKLENWPGCNSHPHSRVWCVATPCDTRLLRSLAPNGLVPPPIEGTNRLLNAEQIVTDSPSCRSLCDFWGLASPQCSSSGAGLRVEWSDLLRTGRVSVVIRWLVRHSWYGPAGQEPAISHETGTRPAGFSYVYEYQLATWVE